MTQSLGEDRAGSRGREPASPGPRPARPRRRAVGAAAIAHTHPGQFQGVVESLSLLLVLKPLGMLGGGTKLGQAGMCPPPRTGDTFDSVSGKLSTNSQAGRGPPAGAGKEVRRGGPLLASAGQLGPYPPSAGGPPKRLGQGGGAGRVGVRAPRPRFSRASLCWGARPGRPPPLSCLHLCYTRGIPGGGCRVCPVTKYVHPCTA